MANEMMMMMMMKEDPTFKLGVIFGS